MTQLWVPWSNYTHNPETCRQTLKAKGEGAKFIYYSNHPGCSENKLGQSNHHIDENDLDNILFLISEYMIV